MACCKCCCECCGPPGEKTCCKGTAENVKYCCNEEACCNETDVCCDPPRCCPENTTCCGTEECCAAGEHCCGGECQAEPCGCDPPCGDGQVCCDGNCYDIYGNKKDSPWQLNCPPYHLCCPPGYTLHGEYAGPYADARDAGLGPWIQAGVEACGGGAMTYIGFRQCDVNAPNTGEGDWRFEICCLDAP